MSKGVIGVLFILSFGLYSASAQETVKEKTQYSYSYNEQVGEFNKVPSTREGVDSLLTISWENRNTDFRKGLQAAQQGKDLAESLQYRVGIARAHKLLGLNYMSLGAYEQALDHYLTSLDMFNESDNKEQSARVLNNIATLHRHQDNLEQAAEYYQRAGKQLEETEDKEARVVVTINLGTINYYLGEYENSMTYYEQALELLKGSDDFELLRMITLTNIGNSYAEMGEYEKAERYLLEAIEFFDREGLARNQSGAYIYLAKVYQRSGDLEGALDYAWRGLEKAKSVGNTQYIKEGYERLAEIYEDQQNYREAYNLYKQFKTVQDSILNSEKAEIINEMQVRFDVEQKNRKIELLNKESDLKEVQLARQELWHNFLIIGLLLLAVITGLLYKYNNQKKQANLLLEQKNEEIERKNAQLIRLNEEKEEFMGMAAHDLRNPLSGITSVVSLLNDEEGEVSEDEFREYLDIIEISADRMVNLIDNLLDMNIIENDDSRLNITPVDIQAPIEESVSNFEKNARNKEMHILTRINPDSRPVLANKEALKRILDNLISNAIKYSPAGSRIEIDATMKEENMVLSVKDNGPGIPEEEQGQLFKRFSRLSAKTTGNESSTGLGLYIVKKLVEEMEGFVRCESQPGEGTEFIVTLPLANETKV